MFGKYHKILQPYFNEIKTAFDIANKKVKEAENDLEESYRKMSRLSNIDIGNVLGKSRELTAIKANLAAALRKVVFDLEKK